jgi:branched-chain amino acid aminotransferase
VLALCEQHGIPPEERDFSLTEVYRADELFCTGTRGELAGVTRVEGRTIGGGVIGPFSRRLRALSRDLARSDGVAIVE